MKLRSAGISGFLAISVLVLFLVTVGGCDYITGAATNVTPASLPVINNITPEEANDVIMFSGFFTQIIDVRTPQEYAAGHIPNAVNIDFNAADFKENLSVLDKNVNYIVYCRTGMRSAAASKVMAELGFKYINNMIGGFSDWAAAGLPVEQ